MKPSIFSLTFSIFIFIILNANAQTPAWQWSNSYGGLLNDQSTSITNELPLQSVLFDNDFIQLNNVEIASDTKINIYDNIGRCQLQTIVNGNRIDVSRLPQGFYLLFFQIANGNCYTHKFLKQ